MLNNSIVEDVMLRSVSALVLVLLLWSPVAASAAHDGT
jgi:hypothetical protein